MKRLIAYLAGVLAAPALPLVFVAFLWLTSGHPLNRYSFGYVLWAGFLIIAIASGAAIPALLILHFLRAVRWLWLGVAGYLAGFVLFGAHLLVTRAQPFALQGTPTDVLVTSIFGGVVGWICASTCWFTIDFMLRRNTSIERTREG
jgi:hypothetical protein